MRTEEESSAVVGYRRTPSQRGFTLVEVLVAMAVLTIGLLGVGTALMVQSGGVASAVSVGQAAVTQGYYVSTATALAQDRLEQVKRISYSISGGDAFGADPIPAGFGDENPVSGYPNFNRTVRVTTGSPAANMKTVTVTVSYQLPTATAVRAGSVVLSTLIAARP